MKICLSIAAICCASIVSAAGAQQLTIRSGEHGNFSRLVVPFPQGTRWMIEQGDDAVSLIPEGRLFQYDTSEIFKFIPRERIYDVRTQVGTATVFIRTRGEVHHKSFQLQNGTVVLDIVSGSDDGQSKSGAESLNTMRTSRSDIPHLDLLWKGVVKSGSIESPSIGLGMKPRSTDGRITRAENDLLRNFSRATAQGIFSIDPLTANHSPSSGSLDVSKPVFFGDLALKSQTVIDRDLNVRDNEKILSSGTRCLSDAYFDLTSWVTDQSPIDQISEAHREIVGEFDRDNSEIGEKLVRIYLALGFGAEAKSILKSLNPSSNVLGAYSYIADILDHTDHERNSPISKMIGCNGKVALWAFLGSPESSLTAGANFEAIQAAFSALPRDLRQLVGPDLIEKLISNDARDTAYAIRNSLTRFSLDGEEFISIAQAALDMSAGNQLSAELLLRPIAKTNGKDSAIAFVGMIDARLNCGKSVDYESIKNAEALLQELGETESGLKLRRSTALAYGSVGDFDIAFSILGDWPTSAKRNLLLQAQQELYMQLLKTPDDKEFLRQVLHRQSEVSELSLPNVLQIDLARRVIELGFPQVAKKFLNSAITRTPEGKLILAQAALAEPDPAAAIAYLEGLDGDLSQVLRAASLAELGEHAEASELYLRSGKTVEAGAEAWRGGEWSIAEKFGSQYQRAAIATLVSEEVPSAVTQGLLARSEDLLKKSKRERSLMETIVDDR